MNLEIQHTKDGSLTLLNRELNVTYHSVHGAIEESKHVYINAGLHYAASVFKEDLTIVEIGFGTGLNALLTNEEAKQTERKINYFTLEKYPIDVSVAEKLNYPEKLNIQNDEFLKLHTCKWDKETFINKHFSFSKFKTDVRDFQFPKIIHVVYFDAFAPENVPEMWQEEVLKSLYNCMLHGSCLVTFCAKGNFKRLLKKIGFKVEVLKGAPGKREMTRGIK